MFDSLYSNADEKSLKFVSSLFGTNSIEMGVCPKQDGTTDCGLYAIAVCVALANKQFIPGPFAQEKMRAHLISCLENLSFTPFPC